MNNANQSWGRYSLGFGWNNAEWALGWADLFADFGMGAFIVGPLHIQVTWPVVVDWDAAAAKSP